MPSGRSFLLILGAVLAAPVAALAQNHPATLVSERALDAHVRFLADDAVEGRAPGTRGERLAANYIAAQFRRLSFEPAGDDSTYFQYFTIIRYEPVKSSAPAGNANELAFGTDFVARPVGGDTAVRIDAEAVFVGYGITAPTYGRDDYGDADVRGRIVIAFSGNPFTIDSTRTLGTFYGEETYKRDEARRRGAAGLLLLGPRTAAPPWPEISRRYHDGAWILSADRDALQIVGMLNPQKLQGLAQRSGTTLEALARAADGPGFKPKPLGTLHLSVNGTVASRIRAMNVTGCLPGRGELARERVVAGGHYDHLGIGAPVNGDSIYNGALDNSSGTATLLAAAEAVAEGQARSERTICFVAFSAEERGLLGSQAYVAREPTPRRIIGMLNIDGANLWGLTRDIGVLGMDHSSMGDIITRAAAAEGLTVTVHPIEVRQRFFFRSDHLSFARSGVPSLFLRRGNQLVDGGVAKWQKNFDDYYGTHYHKPSDHVLPWYVPGGAAQQARVIVRALLDIANGQGRPTWVEGSEFGARGTTSD